MYITMVAAAKHGEKYFVFIFLLQVVFPFGGFDKQKYFHTLYCTSIIIGN